MIKHIEREPTNQLTADEMAYVSGGLVSIRNEQISVHYQHPITSPGTTMFRPPSKKRA